MQLHRADHVVRDFSMGVGEGFHAPVFERRKYREAEGQKFEHRRMLDIEYTMLLPVFQYS